MQAHVRAFGSQREVLEYLRSSTRAWSRSPMIRQLAIRAMRSRTPPPRSDAQRAAALLSWARSRVLYVPDIYQTETLQSPRVTLRMGGGDCDDHAVLLGALLRATGQRVRLTASGFGSLSHVFPEVALDGRWYAADSTLPDAKLGALAPGHDTFLSTAEV